jgi:hypothetical protein
MHIKAISLVLRFSRIQLNFSDQKDEQLLSLAINEGTQKSLALRKARGIMAVLSRLQH